MAVSFSFWDVVSAFLWKPTQKVRAAPLPHLISPDASIVTNNYKPDTPVTVVAAQETGVSGEEWLLRRLEVPEEEVVAREQIDRSSVNRYNKLVYEGLVVLDSAGKWKRAPPLGVYGNQYNGKVEGLGTVRLDDDSFYVGSFHHGFRHGHGHFIGPDGTMYTGQFKRDLKHGVGCEWSPDGTAYHGMFRKGKRHGWAIVTYPSGREWQGFFHGGEQILDDDSIDDSMLEEIMTAADAVHVAEQLMKERSTMARMAALTRLPPPVSEQPFVAHALSATEEESDKVEEAEESPGGMSRIFCLRKSQEPFPPPMKTWVWPIESEDASFDSDVEGSSEISEVFSLREWRMELEKQKEDALLGLEVEEATENACWTCSPTCWNQSTTCWRRSFAGSDGQESEGGESEHASEDDPNVTADTSVDDILPSDAELLSAPGTMENIHSETSSSVDSAILGDGTDLSTDGRVFIWPIKDPSTSVSADVPHHAFLPESRDLDHSESVWAEDSQHPTCTSGFFPRRSSSATAHLLGLQSMSSSDSRSHLRKNSGAREVSTLGGTSPSNRPWWWRKMQRSSAPGDLESEDEVDTFEDSDHRNSFWCPFLPSRKSKIIDDGESEESEMFSEMSSSNS